MAFPINTSIPAANNNPSVDQPEMLTNFQNISGFLGVDHAAPGTANAGNHNQVRFNLNQAAPGLNGGVSEIYANSVAGMFGTITSLLYANASQSLRLTNVGLVSNLLITNASGITNKGLLSPWGLIINFGSFTATAAPSASVITFPVAFTSAATIYFIGATMESTTPSGKAVIVDSSSPPTSTTCGIRSTDNRKIYYIAVGS